MGLVHPVCVYLGQNLWIALARGRKAGAGPWYDASTRLAELREAGKMVLPLSGVHYWEVWHRGDVVSRELLGATIRDLSGYATLRSVDAVRRIEIDAYIQRWFNYSSQWVTRSDVLGTGVNHAFDSPFGRFRFVESVAGDGVPEGESVPPPDNWDDKVAEGPGWEWFNLVGQDGFLNGDGLDRVPAHRDGSARIDWELAFRRQIESTPWMRDRLWDLIVDQEIQVMTDELNERCIAASVNPSGLFFDKPASDPPTAMRSLVEGVPTVHVFAVLRHAKHRDMNHPWEQHDFSDLVALSAAVPYCDAVVTEKRWAHIARATGIAKRYGTVLGSGLSGVRAAMALVEG